MLEKSFSINFFLKMNKKKVDLRYVYLRITVDGIPRETSICQKWDIKRWDQKLERAIGTKEDAKVLNHLLESIVININTYKLELIHKRETITSQILMDHVQGKVASKTKVLEEFQRHNDEMFELIPKEYAKSTYDRYVTAKSHVNDYIKHRYNKNDIEFRELNYDFIINYEHYLKTVRNCSNNTSIKYISNFKKIVLRAIAKDIISSNPFIRYKPKKNKVDKKPLSLKEITLIENKEFKTARLSIIRDIFIFQCYTGLSYIDVKELKKLDLTESSDGIIWIKTKRQKTNSNISIPLLPKAIEIIRKYENDDKCLTTNKVLPVRSNQKMNEYLKEIASLCGISADLNTHKARRTFASTITLANGVPIHVVKEMLGHHSVKQTEEYALTEEEAIGKEMKTLTQKLENISLGPSNTSIRKNLLENLNKINLDDDKLNLLNEIITKLL